MKYTKDSEAVLHASGRKVRLLESTDAEYVKVEVLDTGARLIVEAVKFRVTSRASVGGDFLATTPNEEGPDGNVYRLRVEWEEGELTEVADEQMTSASEKARPVKRHGNILCLTRDHVRWLHGQLGELLSRWDARVKAAE